MFAQHSFAFCFAPQLHVSDEFYVSDLVLTGTVLYAENVVDPTDPKGVTGTFYTMEVDATFRGKAPRLLKLYSENSTARFPMELHRRYVLFLTLDIGRNWVVDNCGNSGELSKAADTMSDLKELPLARNYIYGDVFGYGSPDAPCDPMQLTVRAAGFF
jgi:hypothetical protein